MSFTPRAEGAETVVRCDACGWEEVYCNRDLCDRQCPPDCETRELAALLMAAENHCEDCHHASHAARCFFVATPKGRYIECQCRHKREVPDDPDTHRRDDRGDPGVDTPALRRPFGIERGLGSVEHEARCRIAAAGIELSDVAEDILTLIGEVGRTVTEGAKRAAP